MDVLLYRQRKQAHCGFEKAPGTDFKSGIPKPTTQAKGDFPESLLLAGASLEVLNESPPQPSEGHTFRFRKIMKKTLLATALLATFALPALAQSGSAPSQNNPFGQVINVLGGILNGDSGTRPATPPSGNYPSSGGTQSNSGTIGNIFGGNNSVFGNTNTGIGGLSQSDIARGLREALTVGAQNASNRLSSVNGFFGDALVKILLPPEAQKVERTLRSIGMGNLVDKAVLSMNRAAEDAAVKAAPIFINAITSMSIQDGIGILQGGRNAATQYLRTKTTMALTDAFRPVIDNSLNKVNATALWGTVFNTYNSLPTTRNRVNPDLTGYVTERALNGLFLKIGDEEAKIRTNPTARVSDILQKVFGAVGNGRR